VRDLLVRLIPIDQVIPDPRNSRTHSDAQVAAVAASIAEFGWTNPILVRPNGVVIAGHCRLLSARSLGLQEVPVIELSGLSEAQCRALVIADNRLALNAAWDEDLLRAELAALQEEQFDLELLGFDDGELARLLAAETSSVDLRDPDVAPPAPQTPVSVTGDLWLLGKHRLLCGDATRREVIDLVLAGGQADMVFADLSDKSSPEGKPDKLLIDGDSPGSGHQNFLREACANLIAVSHGAIYLCTSSAELQSLCPAFTAAGGHWSASIICTEHSETTRRSDYQRQYDPILYGWREGSEHYWCGARDQGDVWTIQRPTANRQFPTRKSVELVERAVENSSRRGDTVLDPFAGSGTTLIACERKDRKARLIEIDPRYADVICERWEQYSGQPAIRNSDNRAFGELIQERRKQAPPFPAVAPSQTEATQNLKTGCKNE
jgi:ParB-like chromosome segregation protein Spo0J